MLGRVFKSWSVTDTDKKDAPKPIKNEQLLPNQISGRILDLEMECEKQTISKNVVFELLAEYTKAVQFYEQQGNQKYKLYQKRMHNFLTRPMVESILKGQSGEMVIKKERNEETIRKAENKAQQEAKILLQKHEEKQKKHDSIIKEQLSKQDEILEERIRKKRAMSNKSMQSEPDTPSGNNQQSGKKEKQKEKMNAKLFLFNNIEQRTQRARRVFL